MSAIHRLLAPQSIAVIGASADLTKTSGRPVAYLTKHGYQGKIFPVNPTAASVAGLPCYPSVAALPETPDVAIVMLGAEKAIAAVRELSELGTSAAIVLASGYAELGAEGVDRQQRLEQAAGNMRILGPNTIGLVNLTDGITLSASSALEADGLLAGNIALVSQSGGILGSLLSRGAAQGVGFSKLICTSNEVDLQMSDFVEALIDDAATSVIALYMETVRDPQRFRQVCLKARRAGKPIVAFKVGRSEAGARSAVSHTGAMAGSDRMYDALFDEVGIVRVTNFADLLNVPMALSTGRALRGNRIAILTSTGGAGTLVADSLGLTGFDTDAPDADTAQTLRALEGGHQFALDRNPIDVTLAGLDPTLLRSIIRTLLTSDAYDALVTIVGSSALAKPTLMSEAISDCLGLNDKPIMAYVSPHAPHIVHSLNTMGIAAYSAPEACAAAFSAMRQAADRPQRRHEAVAVAPDLNLPYGGRLNETQSKDLFARFDLPVTREMTVSTAEQAEQAAQGLQAPLVLKLLSEQITHKSDIGGVVLNLNESTVGAALTAMRARVSSVPADAMQFLVQEMVHDGEELIIGLARDPLGAAIMLGSGGITAELFNDTVLMMQPVDRPLHRSEAAALVQKTRLWPLLNGYRGQPARDVDALVTAIVNFSSMVHHMGERLIEAEINPLFVKRAGEGVVAADGVVVLA